MGKMLRKIEKRIAAANYIAPPADAGKAPWPALAKRRYRMSKRDIAGFTGRGEHRARVKVARESKNLPRGKNIPHLHVMPSLLELKELPRSTPRAPDRREQRAAVRERARVARRIMGRARTR